MGRQIIKQPDGKYCVYSSICEDLILIDASPEDIIEMYVEESTRAITEDVMSTIAKLGNQGKPYHQFTKSFEQVSHLYYR